MSHTPVLLKEAMEYLAVRPGGKYIDATFGAGGHSRDITRRGGSVLGIDMDPSAHNPSQPPLTFRGGESGPGPAPSLRVREGGRELRIVHGNFADIGVIARENGFTEVDGILFDLGLSSGQLDDPVRGFSFQRDGPLDMRFDSPPREEGIEGRLYANNPLLHLPLTRGRKSLTAADIINHYSEKELVKIFYDFGEERRFGKRVARAIIEIRKSGGLKASVTSDVAETFRFPIFSTAQLFDIIKRALPANLRFRAGDTARRIFQALRIAVNKELENLEKALPQAVELIRSSGRLVVISFHSLEDRIVKKFLMNQARGCVCPPEFPECVCGKTPVLKILTKKPVTAAEEEIKLNSRSKNAKLRVAERV